MQVPILSGVYTDAAADFRVAYPVNLIPVIQGDKGLSAGYLRPADGLTAEGTGPGVSRGGINWRGVCYRVMGTKFVSVAVNGTITTIADVGSGGDVTFDYSFDRLACVVGRRLWYLQLGPSVFNQVTDPNLIPSGSSGPIDMIWIDGYFAVTDGSSVIVSDLNDPTKFNPLKYGSSEVDPDQIVAVEKLRGELHVVNRHTIEVFRNIGGRFFPFQRIEGAMIFKGALGTRCVCVFGTSLAMIGSGRNESPSIYLASGGQTIRIGTREIDTLLRQYTELQLSTAVVEARVDRDHEHLWVRLPDRTLVYDAAASRVVGEPVWFILTSALSGFSAYRARDLVWCYDKWVVGDSANGTVGRLDDRVSAQYGTNVRWEFGTMIIYNEGRGALVHELELVAVTGRVAAGLDPLIQTSHSSDGEVWTTDRSARAGMRGDRLRRIVWLQLGHLRNWRIQRFRGDSRAFVTFTRLQAKLEGLAS